MHNTYTHTCMNTHLHINYWIQICLDLDLPHATLLQKIDIYSQFFSEHTLILRSCCENHASPTTKFWLCEVIFNKGKKIPQFLVCHLCITFWCLKINWEVYKLFIVKCMCLWDLVYTRFTPVMLILRANKETKHGNFPLQNFLCVAVYIFPI